MKVGVVGNPRYPDLKSVLREFAAIAPARGLRIITEPSLVPLWEEVRPLLEELRALGQAPAYITQKLAGAGFVELVDTILQHRRGQP